MVARLSVRQLNLAGKCLPRVAILLALAAPIAMAVPVTYTFTATGSGMIGSTPFTNVLVTVTAIGDTNAIFQASGQPNDFVNPTQASVSIPGVGTANFTGGGQYFGTGTLPHC